MGASVMLGVKSGVGKLLQDDFPGIVLWHCLNHRLELAVDQALEATGGTKDFQAFLDSLYSLYSQSLKNMRELSECANNLHIQELEEYSVFAGLFLHTGQSLQVGTLIQHWHNVSVRHQRMRQGTAERGLKAKVCCQSCAL